MSTAPALNSMPVRDIERDDLLLELVCDLLRQGREATFVARGSSMHPIVRSGDKVTAVPLAPAALRRGIVVLYLAALPDGGQGMVIHRFCGRDAHGDCLLQGDACPLPDPPVKEEQIIGRIVAVQRGARCWRADSWLGQLLLAESVAVPRLLARLADWHSRWRAPQLPFLPVTHGRLLRERALLRRAVARKVADDESASADTQITLTAAGSERDLLPLLCYRWREEGAEVAFLPAGALEAEMEALVWSARAEAALRWLAQTMAAAKEEILLVKGASLAWSVYPAPHCRPAADLDVIVKQEHRERIIDRLLRAGAALAEPEYHLSFYLRFKNEVALRLPGAGWPTLEIHWRGGSTPWYNRRVGVERFWADTRPSPFGEHLRIMNADKALVFNIAHLAKHFPWLRLLWAVDLALLAEQIEDWPRVADEIGDAGLALPGAVICRWLADHIPGALPSDFLHRLAMAAMAAGWGERRLFARLDKGAGYAAEILAQPDFATALAFARQIILPPERTLRRMSGWSDAPVAILHARRALRLLLGRV